MKKKNNDLSVFAFYALLILTILFLISNCLTSGFLARYLSSDSSNDDARVATWEINFDDGSELNASIPSTHLENGSKGEWGLDIINNSEVAAKISESSNVKLRLYSPNFHADHHHDKWDFLEDANSEVIDNPINFRIYAYNCSLSELKDSYFNDGVFDSSLLEEGVSIEERLILNTDSTVLNFVMNLENGIICYEADINVGNLGETFNLDASTGNVCIRVVWDVTAEEGSYTSKDAFKSYHLIESSSYDKLVYSGVVTKASETLVDLTSESLTDEQINTYIENNSYTISDTKYIIAYKEYDAFDYLIYSSSLGGEVMITLEDSEGTYVKKCTQLTDAEKTVVEARTNTSISDIDTLAKFVEKLEYHGYNEFLTEKKAFEDATGYLGLGLECRISLNLRVEQID